MVGDGPGEVGHLDEDRHVACEGAADHAQEAERVGDVLEGVATDDQRGVARDVLGARSVGDHGHLTRARSGVWVDAEAAERGELRDEEVEETTFAGADVDHHTGREVVSCDQRAGDVR